MDNDNQYMKKNYGQKMSDSLYCNRCKIREADFTCESCDPFRYFCANCDGYVHSATSKRKHMRSVLYKGTEEKGEDRVDFDSLKSFSTDHKTINVDSSYIHNLNNFNNNSRSNLMSVDYVNMKTITGNSIAHSPRRSKLNNYDNEHMSDNISALQNQLENVQNILNEKIASLQIQLEDTNKKNNLNMKILNDEHTLEIRKILNDKDGEIRNLRYKNEELERFNLDLKFKFEQANLTLSQTEMEFGEYLNRMDLFGKKREIDFEELKNFNENRLKIISDNFSQEKTKLINYYEKNMEKLNLGYKESKEKYINLLTQREDDIKEILQKMRTEENKYNEIISAMKTDITKLREENINISKSNKNLQQEIKMLVENLEKTKKDLKFFIKQSKSFEEESKALIQEKEETKIKFDKLHRITHGKFKNSSM